MYNCLGARKRFIFIYYLFNMCMQQKRNVGTKFDIFVFITTLSEFFTKKIVP